MIDPVILKIGSLEVRYYGVLFVIAFILGYYLVKKLAKEYGIEEKHIEDLSTYILIAIIIGARLFEVLFYNPEYYFSQPLKIFYLWEGGLASHGAIIGGIIVVWIYSKRKKISFYKIADLFIIPISLGAAFIRIGNFINSELVGKITTTPWAVKFNNYDGLRHPVQIYQSFYYLIIFLILLKLRKNKKEGTLFWSFLLMEGIFRFLTEFFKDLPKNYGLNYLGLNLAQYISIILIIIALPQVYKRIKNFQGKSLSHS